MAESVVKCCYNGSEYHFVSKDPAQIEDLQCPVCFELAYEPVLTICGHLFCHGCVRGQRSCPTCRSNLHYMRNQRDDRKVKRLKVDCPNWEKGCEWQGDLGDTAQHTSTNCQMETVPCPRGCHERVLRGLLDQHAFTCARPHKCPHCGFEDAHADITSVHFTGCGEFPLICPAECCKHLPRSKMAEHLAVCEEELVPCEYAPIGCTEVIKRKDLQTHLQDKKDYHLEKSLNMVMQYNMVLAEVTATRRVKRGFSHIPIPFRLWLQNTPTCYPRPPWVIKLEGFQEEKDGDEMWFSDPVYSHFGGYMMYLCVHANGYDTGKGTHVSVYVYLMRGDNGDNLRWPFKGTIKLSLLNQLKDGQHHTRELWSPDHVIEDVRAVSGHGMPEFIPHQGLAYKGYKNCQYWKDNTLFFRVECIHPKLD